MRRCASLPARDSGNRRQAHIAPAYAEPQVRITRQLLTYQQNALYHSPSPHPPLACIAYTSQTRQHIPARACEDDRAHDFSTARLRRPRPPTRPALLTLVLDQYFGTGLLEAPNSGREHAFSRSCRASRRLARRGASFGLEWRGDSWSRSASGYVGDSLARHGVCAGWRLPKSMSSGRGTFQWAFRRLCWCFDGCAKPFWVERANAERQPYRGRIQDPGLACSAPRSRHTSAARRTAKPGPARLAAPR